MNIENSMKPPLAKPVTSFRAINSPRTRNQLRETATADALAIKARWITQIGETRKIWKKVTPEGMAKVNVIITNSQDKCRFTSKSAMKHRT